MNDQTKVSFGKPKATGAIYVAPKGTAVPTDATTALPVAFKGMGYASEDGLVNATEADNSTVHAWGGDKVLEGQTTFAEMFTVNLIETNVNTLELYYGEDNVTVTGENIKITQNKAELPEAVVVFEMVMTGGRIKRIILPRGRITDRSGELAYKDGDAISYPAVFVAFPDADGNTHTEYIAVSA